MAEQKEMETMESQETENMEPEKAMDTPGTPEGECEDACPPENEETEEASGDVSEEESE